MKKFTKDELAEILKRIYKQDSFNDMKTEVEDIADELNIDISEMEPDEEEEDVVLEDEVDIDWDAEDSEDERDDWRF